MKILVIDTATSKGVVALVDGDILVEERLPAGLQNSSYLMPAVDKVARGVTLDLIVVGVGPGSYTGLRVGAAVAKALSFANGVPLAGVSTLVGFCTEGAIAAIDAKIGGVYIMEPGGEPKVVPAASLNNTTLIVTPEAAPLQKRIEGVEEWREQYPDVTALAREGQNAPTTTDGSVELLYLRKTQAEIERS